MKKTGKYKFTSLNHDVAGAWKISNAKSNVKENPIHMIGWVYDGSFGRLKENVRGVLLNVEGGKATLITKQKKLLKVSKNTLVKVC